MIGLLEEEHEKIQRQNHPLSPDYESDYGKINRFSNIRHTNKLHLLSDAFSLNRDQDFVNNLGRSEYTTRRVPFHNLMRIEDSQEPKSLYDEDEISLIRASDYVCQNNKVVNDALFPKNVLKTVKKVKDEKEGNLNN